MATDPAHRAAIAPCAAFFTRPLDAVVEDLESYARLLEKWQRVQNLVSRETLGALWTRHFADSLQLLKRLAETDLHVMDIGSGGGFPALPLAIAGKGGPRRFTLIEPNARKVSFLRTVARELGLAVRVLGMRADEVDSRETGTADVVTARALAPLAELCGMAAPLLKPTGKTLFLKGREHGEELARAAALWHYQESLTNSDTDPGGALVELTGLRSR